MKIFIVGLALLMVILTGCWQDDVNAQHSNKKTDWPKDLHKHIGKKITLTGTALDSKLGAVLSDDDRTVWIDNLNEWPNGYYQGGDRGKRVRVTGTLIERDDLPTFVAQPGEPQKGGIPVASEKDQAAAKRRFLLKDAEWKLIE